MKLVLFLICGVSAATLLFWLYEQSFPPARLDSISTRESSFKSGDGRDAGFASQTKPIAEADEDISQGEPNRSETAEGTAPSAIVATDEPKVTPEQQSWAENFYRNPEALVKADRYRFIHVDWDVFYNELEKTPAYLAASSGRTPPPVYDDSPSTFHFVAFNDRPIELLVTDVRFYGEPGSRRIVMRGHLVGSEYGTFRLATTEGQNDLSGRIETPDSVIRVDTLNGASFTTVAEIDRATIENAGVPVDSP